jgi:hypothetical protein
MKDQVQHQRYRARFVKLKLTFVVVDARIEARVWMLDTRTSKFELLASIPASSPITV